MDNLAIRTTLNEDYTALVLTEVSTERLRQDAKFGDQTGHSDGMWLAILTEEFGEIGKALCEGDDPYDEIIQTAAVAVNWAECWLIRKAMESLKTQTQKEKDDIAARQAKTPVVEEKMPTPIETLLARVRRQVAQREAPDSVGDEEINIGRLGQVDRLN